MKKGSVAVVHFSALFLQHDVKWNVTLDYNYIIVQRLDVRLVRDAHEKSVPFFRLMVCIH